MPDPRAAGRGAIDPVLAEIVAAEGPILASRAYALYNKAVGRQEAYLDRPRRRRRPRYRLRMAGRVEIARAEERARRARRSCDLAGSPRGRVRELGRRSSTRSRSTRSPS